MSAEVLSSWKEIAAYTGRGIRTLQRWERELGFPVQRSAGKLRGAVVAVKSEIDLWFRMPHHENDKDSLQRETFAIYRLVLANVGVLKARTSQLAERRQALRAELQRARKLISALHAVCGPAGDKHRNPPEAPAPYHRDQAA